MENRELFSSLVCPLSLPLSGPDNLEQLAGTQKTKTFTSDKSLRARLSGLGQEDFDEVVGFVDLTALPTVSNLMKTRVVHSFDLVGATPFACSPGYWLPLSGPDNLEQLAEEYTQKAKTFTSD